MAEVLLCEYIAIAVAPDSMMGQNMPVNDP